MKDMLTATFTPVDVSNTEFLQKFKKRKLTTSSLVDYDLDLLFFCVLIQLFVYTKVLFGRKFTHLHHHIHKLVIMPFCCVEKSTKHITENQQCQFVHENTGSVRHLTLDGVTMATVKAADLASDL